MFKAKESTPNKANTLSRGKCQGIVFSGRGADKKHNANLKGLHSMLTAIRMAVTSSQAGNNLGGLLLLTGGQSPRPSWLFFFVRLAVLMALVRLFTLTGTPIGKPLRVCCFLLAVRQPDRRCSPSWRSGAQLTQLA